MTKGKAVTDRVLQQGKALVRAIEALETIEPTGPIERAHARFLLQAHRRRLRGIVALAPEWVAEDILSASQRTQDTPGSALDERELNGRQEQDDGLIDSRPSVRSEKGRCLVALESPRHSRLDLQYCW
jgi:hypothetical protein